MGNISGLCGQSFLWTFISIVTLAFSLIYYSEYVRAYLLNGKLFSQVDSRFRESSAFRKIRIEIAVYSILMFFLYFSSDWISSNLLDVNHEMILFIFISLFVIFLMARSSQELILKFSYLLIVLLVGGVLYLKNLCPADVLDILAIFIAIWGLKFRFIEVEKKWWNERQGKKISFDY